MFGNAQGLVQLALLAQRLGQRQDLVRRGQVLQTFVYRLARAAQARQHRDIGLNPALGFGQV